MGGSFYSGWLIPRETSLVIWGFERKRFKGLKDQGKFSLSQITAKEDSQKEGIPQNRHLFARQGNNKAKTCHSG
jgi:hypothetical protein